MNPPFVAWGCYISYARIGYLMHSIINTCSMFTVFVEIVTTANRTTGVFGHVKSGKDNKILADIK
jgi:hypothetical protein